MPTAASFPCVENVLGGRESLGGKRPPTTSMVDRELSEDEPFTGRWTEGFTPRKNRTGTVKRIVHTSQKGDRPFVEWRGDQKIAKQARIWRKDKKPTKVIRKAGIAEWSSRIHNNARALSTYIESL